MHQLELLFVFFFQVQVLGEGSEVIQRSPFHFSRQSLYWSPHVEYFFMGNVIVHYWHQPSVVILIFLPEVLQVHTLFLFLTLVMQLLQLL